MRLTQSIIVILLIAFASQARSSVSGFAVAPRSTTGYDYWGCSGPLMRYDITSGVTTQTRTIFSGQAHYATLNPDGQRVAFILATGSNGYLTPSAIVEMNANGGPLDTLVTGLPDGHSRTFLDWPTGDWLFYGTGSTSTDGSYNGAYYSSGITDIWKVNVTSKQIVHIASFFANNDSLTDSMTAWQMGVSNDGLKCIARMQSDPIGDGYFGFLFSDFPSGIVSFFRPGDSLEMSSYGCGASISPDGNYTMFLTGRDHQTVGFKSWGKAYLCEAPLATMATWLSAGDPAFCNSVSAMDNNRWSCNDPKWVCLMVGWDGRNAAGSSNQVLCNWVDHEIVRTSNDTENLTNSIENETGDFWVNNPTPIVNQLTPPTAGPSNRVFKDSVLVTLADTTPGTQIYYTLDGLTPPDSTIKIYGYHVLLYTAPIKLTQTTTIMARAYKSGWLLSDSLRVVFTQGVTTGVVPSSKAAMHSQNFTITLFDMLGRQIKTNSRAFAWDGATLSGVSLKKGVYFVELRSGEAVQTRKLVIQK